MLVIKVSYSQLTLTTCCLKSRMLCHWLWSFLSASCLLFACRSSCIHLSLIWSLAAACMTHWSSTSRADLSEKNGNKNTNLHVKPVYTFFIHWLNYSILVGGNTPFALCVRTSSIKLSLLQYREFSYSAMVSLWSSSAIPDTSSSAVFLRACSWLWSCWTLERVWANSTKLCSTSSQASWKPKQTCNSTNNMLQS